MIITGTLILCFRYLIQLGLNLISKFADSKEHYNRIFSIVSTNALRQISSLNYFMSTYFPKKVRERIVSHFDVFDASLYSSTNCIDLKRHFISLFLGWDVIFVCISS